LCFLLRWRLLQSLGQTLAESLSPPAIANKALIVMSAAAERCGPLGSLNLSTIRLFIQRETPCSAPSRPCRPVSLRDGSSPAGQFRSRAVVAAQFGRQFRSLVAFIAASASNSVHCGRKRPGNGAVQRVR
jgi:hypothetical protein